MIALTETWLKPDNYNSELFCNKYVVYRFDRISRAGGVLIAVDSSISSELLSFDNTSDIEFIAVKLLLPSFRLFICCSYIPPGSDLLLYNCHKLAILNLHRLLRDNDRLVVLGDFNLPTVKWIKNTESISLTPTAQHEFICSLLDLSLLQINEILNCNNKMLDLVFVSGPSDFSLSRASPLSLPEDKHHPTLDIACDIDIPNVIGISAAKSCPRSRCFRKADFAMLEELITSHDWSELFACNDIESASSIFYSSLDGFFSHCVPLQHTKIGSTRPPWFSRNLAGLKNIKSKLYKRFQRTGKSTDFSKYLIARANFLFHNKQSYDIYLNRCKLNFFHNPKQFYSFVNSKRKCSGFPSSLFYGNKISSSDKDSAELFAEFFKSTFSSDISNLTYYPYCIHNSSSIRNPVIDYDSVFRSLSAVKAVYSPGPDGVPACVLTYCASSLSEPILKLFKLSLKSAAFPAIWKQSFIIPLHKKGSRSNIENYRGIAKLSAIPKVFEQIITCQLQHMCKSLMSPYQHGFVRCRSTTTNLLEFSSLVRDGFLSYQQTDVIYTDFSKAFDSVNHKLLIYKLDLLGFPQNLLLWLTSYLSDRTQNVLYNNTKSSLIAVTSGVPQGSHLGPLLFTLFINDLPQILKHSRALMYADDVKLCHTFLPSDPSSRHLLQADLFSFQCWCAHNFLSLNCSKCKIMTFHRVKPFLASYLLNSSPLERLSTVNDLGVLFDPKLSFNVHISSIVNKATSTLGFVKRWAKEFNDPYLTKTLYTSLVRPILEYCSCVWSPAHKNHIMSIESVQKKFLIFALRGLNWDVSLHLPPYRSRLLLINLPTLENRRILLGVLFIHKLVLGEIDSPDLLLRLNFAVPARMSRHYVPFYLPLRRQNFAKFDPLRIWCAHYNDLYSCISLEYSTHMLKRLILSNLD